MGRKRVGCRRKGRSEQTWSQGLEGELEVEARVSGLESQVCGSLFGSIEITIFLDKLIASWDIFALWHFERLRVKGWESPESPTRACWVSSYTLPVTAEIVRNRLHPCQYSYICTWGKHSRGDC